MGWWTDIKRSAPGDVVSGYGDWWGDRWNDVTGKTAARDARDAELSAADKAQTGLQQAFGDARALQQPYLDMGQQDYGRLRDLVTSGAYDVPDEQYQAPQFNFEADPGYQFRMDQGAQAVNRRAAAGGRALGGGVLKELTRYGQGQASDEYGRAFDRFDRNRGFDYGAFADRQTRRSGERGARYGRMAGLADLGPRTAENLAGNRMGFGNTLADLDVQRGNARAAGIGTQYGNQRDTLMGFLGLGAQYAGARGGRA